MYDFLTECAKLLHFVIRSGLEHGDTKGLPV